MCVKNIFIWRRRERKNAQNHRVHIDFVAQQSNRIESTRTRPASTELHFTFVWVLSRSSVYFSSEIAYDRWQIECVQYTNQYMHSHKICYTPHMEHRILCVFFLVDHVVFSSLSYFFFFFIFLLSFCRLLRIVTIDMDLIVFACV